jgi:hypothetical protein
LKRRGSDYVLRFDPAELLQGATARRAAVEDKVIAPGEVMTNDFYIREDGHKLLTFSVPGNARVTVVTNEGPGLARLRFMSSSSLESLAANVPSGNT